jgi:hypothetical protein
MRLITSAFLLAGVLASPEVIYRNGELALQDPTGKGQTLLHKHDFDEVYPLVSPRLASLLCLQHRALGGIFCQRSSLMNQRKMKQHRGGLTPASTPTPRTHTQLSARLCCHPGRTSCWARRTCPPAGTGAT